MAATAAPVFRTFERARPLMRSLVRARMRGGFLLLVLMMFGALLAPMSGEAQPTANVPRIGMLVSGSPATYQFLVDAFRRNLRELGYVEGRNMKLELRWAEGKLDRLPDLADNLVRIGVDIIVVGGTPAVRAAKQATSTIPIVVWGAGDLVETGLVATLARPGGNITGTHDLSPESSGKRLELLKETVPRLSRVAILWSTAVRSLIAENEAAARVVGVHPQLHQVRTPHDFQGAYAAMARERVNGLVIVMDSFILFHRRQLLDLALKNRLPTVCEASEFARDGCLIAFGPDRLEAMAQAAVFVDRILKGANPANLPIDQPKRFDLILNLSTAKALNLTVPQTLLLRANHVIQ
jgi:putative tryptophan/tyrosine transport system substrate-binding protein